MARAQLVDAIAALHVLAEVFHTRWTWNVTMGAVSH
jgi:hypothetical protein